MTRLPVIVGFGGFNAAGRSSFHHGFRRMVMESIEQQQRQETVAGLAVMMKLIDADAEGFKSLDGDPLTLEAIEEQYSARVVDGTLIRRIEKSFFDVDAAPWQQNVAVEDRAGGSSFVLSRKQLPNPVPTSWQVSDFSDTQVRITLPEDATVRIDSVREMPVKSAGQLPRGFNPGDLYRSRFHPRGLQLTITGMSDALHSMGIEWETIRQSVPADQIAVFAGSVMSQVDEDGMGGMFKSRLRGSRVSSKQLPLGLNSMVADFVNAYVLGSVGTTGCVTGACATFLYNMKLGIDEIQSGRARIAIVGSSEAPIEQEVIEGFSAMSALGTEEGLKRIDGADETDPRRSSRPFAENCGFTIAEASQFVILMDDELALELGAQIHGAMTDVFINADGYKKSISAPGPGNYITMAKAVASARELLGEDAIRKRSMVHAHGSSTPANRVTESELFDRVAKTFGIESWPVTAVKAYVGHTIGPASGDQLVAALGSFAYDLIPGIKTIDKVADDVFQDHLQISTTDVKVDGIDAVFINSKGFGGNNATGVVISPAVVKSMLSKRYGQERMAEYEKKAAQSRVRAEAYDQSALLGQFNVEYNFGQNMIDDADINISCEAINLPGSNIEIDLSMGDRYADLKQ